MKKILLLAVMVVLLALVLAVPAFAAPSDFCSPWNWYWFKTGNGWWYWQFVRDCWNPQSGWYQIWGNWDWA